MRRAIAAVFVTLLPALAAGPAWADPPSPTVLHLTQSADRKLTRDVLHVELRAEKTGGDAQTVQAAINQGMAKALAEARQAQGIEVETGSYAVYHVESQSQWSGSQSLFLSGGDQAAVLKLAGSLQGQGLVMSNLGFQASPKTVRAAEDALTAEALAGLERRAAAIAAELHLAVLGYRDLTVGNAETGGGPMPRFAGGMAMAAAMPAPVAAAGEATVRVTVSAEVLLGTKQP
ncbi:MAG TPA: SIMPL domain-containing protein [Stellaceae bacterium]|nr:SIMPL domain-containing protein [Stellaceae bacterium]